MTTLFTLGAIKTLVSVWFFQRSYKRYMDVDRVDDMVTANLYATFHMGYLLLGTVTIISAVGDFVQNYQM
jgi:uncharacterized membrane protein